MSDLGRSPLLFTLIRAREGQTVSINGIRSRDDRSDPFIIMIAGVRRAWALDLRLKAGDVDIIATAGPTRG